MTEYLEKLPRGCPPDDAREIGAPCTVYRLVEAKPPTSEDFKSLRSLGNTNDQLDECLARGISVFSDIKDAENQIGAVFKFRSFFVCHVQLGEGAGVIKKTGKRSHHTWWPYANYNILDNCHITQP